MANNVDLVMRLLAEDKASAAFKKVGGAVDDTGSKYGKFAKKAATALAAVGVVKFASDSVRAYKEAEASQAKLTLAYQKFPKTANVSIESLRAYNSELQTKTKYDDDDTAAMQAHLAMFDLTGQQIKALTPLVQDLASAQGIDLASASDLVGKALMGNARGLKALGIDFKSTGDRAKDYATIQAALNEKVGGFAENEGKTAAGQAAILANQWGDLQETVGGALVPVLNSLIGVVKPVVQAFNSLPEGVKTTTVAVGVLGAGFVLLAPKLIAAKTLLMETGAAAGVTGAKIKGAGKVIGGAVAVLGVASAANNAYSESTTNVNDALSLLAGNHATDQIGTSFAHIFGAQTKMDDAAAALGVIDGQLATLVGDGNLTSANAQFTDLRNQFVAMGGEVEVFDKQFPQYRASLDSLEKPTTAVADATSNLGSTAMTAAKQLEYYKARIDKVLNKNLDAKKRALAWKDALADLTNTVKENGKSLDENTQKGRNNENALLDLIQQTNDNATANLNAGASYDVVKKKHDTEIAALREQAYKLGFNKKQVDALIAAYGKLPAKVSTTIAAPGAATTLSTLRLINAEIRKMPGHAGVAVTVTGDGDLVGHGTGGTAGKTTTKSVVPSTTRSTSGASADSAHVNVYLDGKHVQTTLVMLKRRQGGSLAF